MSAQLISLSQILAAARHQEINLGKGNPEEHIFYLAKRGLVPKATRKRVKGKVEGYYPAWILDQLRKIAGLKSKGISYSQMKLYLQSEENHSPSPRALTLPLTSNNLAILVIGLILGYLLAQNSASPSTNKTTLLDRELPEQARILDQPTAGDESRIYSISLPENSLRFLDKSHLDLDINP